MISFETGLVSLKKFSDARGALVALQEGDGALQFAVKRVFVIHRVPQDQVRGQHAHRQLQQLMIAVAGSLDVSLDDGRERRHVTLDDPSIGLLLPAMTWSEMSDFAPGTVCLVLASERFDESDYIRDYETFQREARSRASGAAS